MQTGGIFIVVNGEDVHPTDGPQPPSLCVCVCDGLCQPLSFMALEVNGHAGQKDFPAIKRV